MRNKVDTSRGGLSGTLLFDLFLMTVLLLMLWVVLRPGFEGGNIVRLTVGFTAVFLSVAMFQKHVLGGRGNSKRASAEEQQADTLLDPPPSGTVDEVEEPATSKERWLAIGYVVLVFALVYVFGTLAGCVVFVMVYLSVHRTASLWVAITVALVVGGGTTFVMGSLLRLQLWEGVIPTIIPGLVGGGVPPPL